MNLKVDILEWMKAGHFVTIEDRPVFIGGPGGGGGGVVASGGGGANQTILEQVTNNAFSVKDEQNYKKGMGESYLVEIEGGGLGLLKPPEFESVKDDPSHEVAAYEIATALGLDIVPPTALREMPDGRVASLQAWIEGADTAAALSRDGVHDYLPIKQVQNMWVLDAITGNMDRHTGNFLISRDKKRIHAIDNGMSFGLDVPTFFDFPPGGFSRGYMKKVARTFKPALFRSIKSVAQDDALWDRVAALVGNEKAKAARLRADNIWRLGKDWAFKVPPEYGEEW